MTHPRIDIFNHITRTCIIIAFTIIPSSKPTYLWIIAIIYAVCTISTLISSVWYLPYHLQEACLMQSVMKSIVAWSGICLLVVQAFHSEEKPVGAVMFYAVTPLVIILTAVLVKQRRQDVVEKDISKCSSVYEIEMKARFYIQVLYINYLWFSYEIIITFKSFYIYCISHINSYYSCLYMIRIKLNSLTLMISILKKQLKCYYEIKIHLVIIIKINLDNLIFK